jgi:hypothetical protein
MYELNLAFIDGKTQKRRETAFNKSCANFFDENGLLCCDVIENAVMKLHKSLASDKKES